MSFLKKNYVWPTNFINKLKKKGAQNLGIHEYELMQRAGFDSYKMIRKIWPNAKNWLILCGESENGGYGYIVALLGLKIGFNITVISCNNKKIILSENISILARQEWLKSGGLIYDESIKWPKNIDVIVDALLGIGVEKIPSICYNNLIRKVNNFKSIPVFSIDMPSGLSSSSGIPCENTIKATHTISIGMLKPGQLTGQSRDYVGKLHYSDIGLKNFLIQHKSSMIRYDVNNLKYWLKNKKATSHKGHFGRLLAIGGTIGMSGAIRMTAEAALRTGSGIVKVITHKNNVGLVISGRPELIVYEFTYKNLLQQINWADVIVVGPGLGCNSWSYKIFRNIINVKKPIVFDADALNMLSLHSKINIINNNRILTPHPGEAAKLLGTSIAVIENNRILAVKNLVKRYGGVIILKGAGTIIANESGNIAFADVGDASMSSAGMGDILSGIIASLIGQKLSIFNAACAGCIIHGASAQYLSFKKGKRGILATDLFDIMWKFVNPDKISKKLQKSL